MVTRIYPARPAIDGLPTGNAAAVGTIRVKPGVRVSKVTLKYVDTVANAIDMLALVGDITCFKNSTEFRLHTAAELDYLNRQNGSQYAYQKFTNPNTGLVEQYLTIWFFEPWRIAAVDRESGAAVISANQGWNENGLEVQVKLLQAIPATGSFQQRAYVDFALQDLTTLQSLKTVKRLNIAAAGTEFDYESLPNVGRIQGINLKNPSGAGVIKSVTFRSDGVTYLDDVTRGEAFDNLTGLNIIPPPIGNVAAGQFAFSWAFDDTDPVQSSLAARTPWLKIKTDVAASGNVVALIESVNVI